MITQDHFAEGAAQSWLSPLSDRVPDREKPSLTSPTRLRELERACEFAEQRLRRDQRELSALTTRIAAAPAAAWDEVEEFSRKTRTVRLQFAAPGVACSVSQTGTALPKPIRTAAGPRRARCEMCTSSTLGYHQDVIEGMMSASEPFGQVETFINEAAVLDQDEKAALWLLAWSLRDAWTQQREALSMLSALAWRQAPG
jgi:hypothetical protein